jgi:hypothetical protein
MRYLTAVLALLLLAGCGSSPPTVHGQITDTLIGSSIGCNPSNGTLQVVLTDSSGKAIARDNATFKWDGKACVVPFSFTNVPQLAGYGIRVNGLGGTTWLTPAQAAKPVNLRIS